MHLRRPNRIIARGDTLVPAWDFACIFDFCRVAGYCLQNSSVPKRLLAGLI